MNGQYSKSPVSTSSMGATTATSSGVMSPRQRMAQNFLLIWMDADIDQSQQNYQNTLAQLRSVVNDVNIFTNQEECIQFLNGIENEKVFIIASGSLGQSLIPEIHTLSQLDTIYIFCDNQSQHAQWAKEWVKIKGVYTQIQPICEELQLAVKQCNQDTIAISFMTIDEEGSSQNLNQLEPNFIYTRIFKEILLEMEYEDKSIQDLAIYCHAIYTGNMKELNIIQEFQCDYRKQSPIWWYTRECFTYQMLNRSLRLLEANTLIKMGFFIHDLHHQIEQLHQRQVRLYGGNSFVVYRGQGLPAIDFAKLLKSRGGLMSFNNFLSTSKKPEMSLEFAKDAMKKMDMVGILFKMIIDPSISSVSFASIQSFSYFKTEEEILFSMHTVFRVDEITKLKKNSPLYQVDLKLTGNDDEDLRTPTEHIRDEIMGEIGWQRLGNLLLKLNQFNKATDLYNVLIEQTSRQSEKALYYHQLGRIRDNQADYEMAIEFYKKSLEIYEKILPANHPSLAISYNNIAGVYKNMGQYSKALLFHEKSLEIREKALAVNHPDLATSYNNIGLVYKNIGEYSKALSFYEKSLQIREKTLPTNHPNLATSYNNIAAVYNNMGEYSKALSFHEKSLEIKEKTLAANHPSLATSYNNIGIIYMSMGEYLKALAFYEKSLEIDEKTLLENHPSLAISYNNIAGVYDNIGGYSKALSFYEKSLVIYEKTLSANHPSLATSYNNIASVYDNMGGYSKALSFYEKSFEIYEKILPANHPSLATSYNNIGIVYKNMREYSKALSFYEKSLVVYEKILPANHPSLATSYNNIAGVYDNMGDYWKALSIYQRALKILRSSFPPNHPHTQSVQKSIEYLKTKMKTDI